jgi:predicted phage tail component-like protein
MTTWIYGGSTLSTFGRVTVVNDYLDTGDRRGENILIPFRHGKVFIQKYYDERKITLGIALIGSSASDLESKVDTLKALLAPKTTQTLSQTREDTTVRTVPATVDKNLQVQRISATIAKAVLEFTLPNPFFRASSATTSTTTINASPKAIGVTNAGTVEETAPTITLTGPLQNTVITNSTNGCTLTYTGTIASPRVVTIQLTANGDWTATTDLGANVIGNVTHSGAPSLFVFDVGANSLSVTDATHTTGTLGFSFYAPYL